MTHRIHPLNSSPIGSGRVHAPGTGQTQGPSGPQGPNPTHPKTLERIGPLAGLMGRGMRPAKEADTRRAELPRSRDAGNSRSWMSSMKHAASKTGQAISYGFNRAGQVVHKFGQALNEPNGEPAWMRHMSDADRAHYDYYGELPAESAHSSYVAPPWEQPQPAAPSNPSYIAAPWEQPGPSVPSHQPERTEVRTRPMTDHEQVAENQRAEYYNEIPQTMVTEYVSRPSSSSVSPGSSPGRTNVEPSEPQRPASRPTGTGRDALLANIRDTIPRMDLGRLDHAEPHDFVRFALHLSRGTRYEEGMKQRADGDPALGGEMKKRWNALQNHLDGLRAQGHENVPSAEWLFHNRSVRMMTFLVDGNGGSKLVEPTSPRTSVDHPASGVRPSQAHPGQPQPVAQSQPPVASDPAARAGSPAMTPGNRALRSEVQGLVEAFVTDRRRSRETRERPLAAMEALDKLSDHLGSPGQYGELLSELKALLGTSNSARRNAGLKNFTDKVTRFTANIERAGTEPQPQMQAHASPPPRYTAPQHGSERPALDFDHFRRQEEQRADYHHERPDYAAARSDYENYLRAQTQPASPESSTMQPPERPSRAESRFDAPSTAQMHDRPLEAFYRDEEATAAYHGVQPNYAEARKNYETQGSSSPQPAQPAPLPAQVGQAVQQYRTWMSSPGFAQRFGSAGRNLMSDALGTLEQHGAKLPPGKLEALVRDLGRIVGESVNNPVRLGQLRDFVADIRQASRPPEKPLDLSLDDFRQREEEAARYYSNVASGASAESAYQAYRRSQSN
jgi:hypothetical protein